MLLSSPPLFLGARQDGPARVALDVSHLRSCLLPLTPEAPGSSWAAHQNNQDSAQDWRGEEPENRGAAVPWGEGKALSFPKERPWPQGGGCPSPSTGSTDGQGIQGHGLVEGPHSNKQAPRGLWTAHVSEGLPRVSRLPSPRPGSLGPSLQPGRPMGLRGAASGEPAVTCFL